MSRLKGSVRYDTLVGLRDEYAAAWGRCWPHNNDDLAELWQETRQALCNDKGNARVPWPVVRQFCLDLMRECDPMPSPPDAADAELSPRLGESPM